MKKLPYLIAILFVASLPVTIHAQHTEEIRSTEKKEEEKVTKTKSEPAMVPQANLPQANLPQPNTPTGSNVPPGMNPQATSRGGQNVNIKLPPGTSSVGKTELEKKQAEEIKLAEERKQANSNAASSEGAANNRGLKRTTAVKKDLDKLNPNNNPGNNSPANNNAAAAKPIYDQVPPESQYQTLPKKTPNQPDNIIPGNNNATNQANYDDVPAAGGQYQKLPKKAQNEPDNIIPANNKNAAGLNQYDKVTEEDYKKQAELNAAQNNRTMPTSAYGQAPLSDKELLAKEQQGTSTIKNTKPPSQANYDDVPSINNNNKNTTQTPAVPKSNYGTIPTDQELLAKEQQRATIKNAKPPSQANYDDIPAGNNNNKTNTKNPVLPKSNYGTIPTDQELLAKEQQGTSTIKNTKPPSQANYDDIPTSNNNNKTNTQNPVVPKSNYGTIPTDQELLAKEQQGASTIKNIKPANQANYDDIPAATQPGNNSKGNNNAVIPPGKSQYAGFPQQEQQTVSQPTSQYDAAPKPRKLNTLPIDNQYGAVPALEKSQYDEAPKPKANQYGAGPAEKNPYGTAPPEKSPYGAAPPEKDPYGVVPAEKNAAQVKQEQEYSKMPSAPSGLTRKPAVKDGLSEKAAGEVKAAENQKKLQELREQQIQNEVNNALGKKAETKAATTGNKTAMTKEKAEADKKMQELREKEINKELKEALEKKEKEKLEKEKLENEKKKQEDRKIKEAAEKKAAEEKKLLEAKEKRLLEEKRKKAHG